MRDWREDLVADLAGEDGLSTQEKALVDVAVRDDCVCAQIAPAAPNEPHRRLLLAIWHTEYASGLASHH